ncbi:HTH-type transcriptional regulator IscR [wastewater metagenome]|uniref:HTH-type transcriptional regulator IscR n=2 Tax=unclassified sequences TaxID=12908 RepID=A0A5B8R8U4_9ZZZZ|nr:Rrf2 family transcriptional regulator [Arhodomonas sp. KWT]QEA05166.1 HTH-type transcriptional regulator IscR [uncultured organism]
MIRLSTKSRYAVSALMHLAIHGGKTPVPLAEISVCQGISVSYVDQIFTRLRHAGLVQGVPGPGGGYRLTRDPAELGVGEIIRVMEADGRGGPRGGSALTRALWDNLSRRLDAYLDDIRLADFVQRPQIREALARQYAGGQWRCDVCGALAHRSAPAAEGYRA